MKQLILAIGVFSFVALSCGRSSVSDSSQREEPHSSAMLQPSLFIELPDSCPTPDGMAIAPDGTLIIACPNFADRSYKAVLMRIGPNGKISKWIDAPVLDETGHAAPMGIKFGKDGDLFLCDNQGWTGEEECQRKGRLLRLRFDDDGNLTETITIASGMEHPNGVSLYGDKVYVTQSVLSSIKSDCMVSGIYCFNVSDRDIRIANDETDPNLLVTVETRNKDVQYGLDGIVIDKNGVIYAGNFGDAAIHRIEVDHTSGKVLSNTVWARDTTQLKSTDGMCMDSDGNIYAADFSSNAIARISPDGSIVRIAQSPDCDGSDGGLDQPGEPIIWNGELIVSCFDLVTGPDKLNSGHDSHSTLSRLKLKN